MSSSSVGSESLLDFHYNSVYTKSYTARENDKFAQPHFGLRPILEPEEHKIKNGKRETGFTIYNQPSIVEQFEPSLFLSEMSANYGKPKLSPIPNLKETHVHAHESGFSTGNQAHLMDGSQSFESTETTNNIMFPNPETKKRMIAHEIKRLKSLEKGKKETNYTFNGPKLHGFGDAQFHDGRQPPPVALPRKLPPLSHVVPPGHTGYSKEHMLHQQVHTEREVKPRPTTDGSMYFIKLEKQRKNLQHAQKHDTGAVRMDGDVDFLAIRGRNVPDAPQIYRSEMKANYEFPGFHPKLV